MDIDTLILGPLSTNCYILSASKRSAAVIIDPAAGAERIDATLKGRQAAAVLLTHGHFDHTGALGAFEGLPIYIHAADAQMLNDPFLSLADMMGDRTVRPAATDHVADGQILTLAGLTVRVLHTPGHTPGSVCYEIGGVLFTGDTLFRAGSGRTDFPGGDAIQESRSIRRLLSLPVDLPVCPGHGPSTRLFDEKHFYM